MEVFFATGMDERAELPDIEGSVEFTPFCMPYPINTVDYWKLPVRQSKTVHYIKHIKRKGSCHKVLTCGNFVATSQAPKIILEVLCLSFGRVGFPFQWPEFPTPRAASCATRLRRFSTTAATRDKIQGRTATFITDNSINQNIHQ